MVDITDWVSRVLRWPRSQSNLWMKAANERIKWTRIVQTYHDSSTHLCHSLSTLSMKWAFWPFYCSLELPPKKGSLKRTRKERIDFWKLSLVSAFEGSLQEENAAQSSSSDQRQSQLRQRSGRPPSSHYLPRELRNWGLGFYITYWWAMVN